MTGAPPDVVTFGEVMIRLGTPVGEALESTATLAVHTGGAEANVAVVLARVGFRTAWISKLPSDPLGRRVAAELRRHGVDVSGVIWTPHGRTGVYFVEHAPPPRGVTVHYDRAGSAFSTIASAEIDPALLRGARWLHLTGITPALSASCAQAAAHVVRVAHEAGARLAFDVNYRRKLWSAEQARSVLEPLVGGADLLIAAQEDARDVFGIEGDGTSMAMRLRERFSAGTAIITTGPDGAHLADAAGVHHEAAVPGGVVDPIGRGDAFTAGVLWGVLEGDIRSGMRYGTALAALTATYWGDAPWVTRQDVLATLAGRAPKPAR
jgi:2-dehydro-3-deoxygluconokinase